MHRFYEVVDALKLEENYKNATAFEPVGTLFCDGFRFPKIKEVFPQASQLRTHFRNQGLQIKQVKHGQKEGYYFVSFESENQITYEFLTKLSDAIKSVRERAQGKFTEMGLEPIVIEARVASIYVNQFDFTWDLAGFFYSNDIKKDHA